MFPVKKLSWNSFFSELKLTLRIIRLSWYCSNSTASTVRRTQSALVSSTISDVLNVMAEDTKDHDIDQDRKVVMKLDSSDVEDTRGKFNFV